MFLWKFVKKDKHPHICKKFVIINNYLGNMYEEVQFNINAI